MKHNESKNVTIADIAQAAGVSKTTVSRYLNGKYSMMSADTRARIETVIRMANYHPNSIAQSLRGRRSMQIGVVVSDISSPFCASMVRGLGHTLLDAGYAPLFADSKDDPKLEKHLIETLLSRKVDGLIVNTSSYVNPSLIQIACDGIPIVLCDRLVSDFRFSFVGCRHKEPVHQLMAHLKEEGFSKVGFFTQDYTSISTRLIRHNAYLEGLKEYFPQEDGEALTFILDLTDRKRTAQCVRQLLDTCGPGEVPAIMAVNSVTCTHILSVIQELGLSRPGDVGLCGPDDWGWDYRYSVSPMGLSDITSFCVYPTQIGEIAAQILLQMIQNPDMEKQEVFLPTEVVIRHSTQLRACRSKCP